MTRRIFCSSSSTSARRASLSLTSWERLAQLAAQGLHRRLVLAGAPLHLLVGGTALLVQRLEGDVQLASLLHQGLEGAQIQRAAAALQPGHHGVEVLRDEFEVEHVAGLVASARRGGQAWCRPVWRRHRIRRPGAPGSGAACYSWSSPYSSSSMSRRSGASGTLLEVGREGGDRVALAAGDLERIAQGHPRRGVVRLDDRGALQPGNGRLHALGLGVGATDLEVEALERGILRQRLAVATDRRIPLGGVEVGIADGRQQVVACRCQRQRPLQVLRPTPEAVAGQGGESQRLVRLGVVRRQRRGLLPGLPGLLGAAGAPGTPGPARRRRWRSSARGRRRSAGCRWPRSDCPRAPSVRPSAASACVVGGIQAQGVAQRLLGLRQLLLGQLDLAQRDGGRHRAWRFLAPALELGERPRPARPGARARGPAAGAPRGGRG